MVNDQLEFLWFLISLFFHLLRKPMSMVPPSPLPWKRLAEPRVSPDKRHKDSFDPKKVLAAPPASELDGNLLLAHEAICELKDDRAANPAPTGVLTKARKRPAKIVIPVETCLGSAFEAVAREEKEKEELAGEEYVEVEGSGYCLASRKGSRHVMEDGYGVITSINGDSKQALYGVFDGHGGRAAVDFVSEKLGKNIIAGVAELEGEEQVEMAIRAAYLTTDTEFLSQGVSSGACATTVVLKNGKLHVSNVGDCRVVLSRKGVASTLTRDHIAGAEDERNRIQSSGGYVTCRNGAWRVHDSLAISRAIGDGNMKEWVISEPDTKSLRLTPDCEFLIMATDGLWDKVSNEEAVNVISRHDKFSSSSCKELVEMAFRRGSRDDITVMVVDLQRFVQFQV